MTKEFGKDLNVWKSFRKTHPLTIAYESAETLPARTVTVSGSPLGIPGIYSNAGNTTVSGRSDPIYVVSDLISQVADLNEIVTNIPKP